MLPRRLLDSIAPRIARIRAPLSVKLQAAFLVLIVVVASTGLVSLGTISRIERKADDLDRMRRAVERARRLDHSIVTQEHLASMLILTGDTSYHTKLLNERKRFRSGLIELGPDGAPIEAVFARYEGASEDVVEAQRAGFHGAAQEMHIAREHVIAHEIEALTGQLVTRFENERQVALTRILMEQRQATWTVAAFFLVSITLALVLGSVLARSIVDPIQRVDGMLARIAAGKFDAVYTVVNRDELGSLATGVTHMSRQLADLYAKERQAASSLQAQFEALSRTQTQLIQAEKLRALGEMAAGVAHDFNNLLTPVLGQAELMAAKLSEGALPAPELQRRLMVIRQAALDGAETVRRLLDFTLARQKPSEVQMLNLKDLVTEVLAVAEPRWKDEAHAQGREIEVVTDLRVAAAQGNSAEIREVLLNLIFNALDAMPASGRLTVSSRADDGAVVLEVGDTGVGMLPDLISRIFEPFYTTKGPQRSGLGLSVSYGIVHRHGGQLSVESRPGQGSTFSLRLPLRAASVASEDTMPPENPASTGLRVLVVDDDEQVRTTLCDILRAAGHHVWEAASGPEALACLEGQTVDTVCTDLGMPGMNGLRLADCIHTRWPETKVGLITGWGARVERQDLAAHGIAFLVAKPFRKEEILRRLTAPALSERPVLPV